MSQLQTITTPVPARFPFSGMACPEPGCDTAVYTTYPKLVQHWKLLHIPTVLFHTCRVCMTTFTRKPDANRHLKACHNAFVYQFWLHANAHPHSGCSSPSIPGSLPRELGPDDADRETGGSGSRTTRETEISRWISRDWVNHQGVGQHISRPAYIYPDEPRRSAARLHGLKE